MDDYYAEQFELPLLSPLSTEKVIILPPPRRTFSSISLLNDDCLSEIFYYLAQEKLAEPPKYGKGGAKSFLTITAQTHQNRDLQACCLVSKAWYPVALHAYYHTLVIRISERDQWYERMPLIAGGMAPHWVKKLVLVGGGLKKNGESPVSKIWELFPNLLEVEIFGLGWGTGSLLCAEGLDRAARAGALRSIKRLEVTATSEYLLSDMPPGKNFLDIQGLLTHLPSLRHLALRGFNGRLPLSPELDALTYELDDMLLEKCSLSLTAFRWLTNSSLLTLREMELPSSSVWDDREDTKTPGVLATEDEMEILAKRLGLELPILCMSRW